MGWIRSSSFGSTLACRLISRAIRNCSGGRVTMPIAGMGVCRFTRRKVKRWRSLLVWAEAWLLAWWPVTLKAGWNATFRWKWVLRMIFHQEDERIIAWTATRKEIQLMLMFQAIYWCSFLATERSLWPPISSKSTAVRSKHTPDSHWSPDWPTPAWLPWSM